MRLCRTHSINVLSIATEMHLAILRCSLYENNNVNQRLQNSNERDTKLPDTCNPTIVPFKLFVQNLFSRPFLLILRTYNPIYFWNTAQYTYTQGRLEYTFYVRHYRMSSCDDSDSSSSPVFITLCTHKFPLK